MENRFIIAKNYRVLKPLLSIKYSLTSFIIAKNYRVLKLLYLQVLLVTRFIIAKNYRVLKHNEVVFSINRVLS